MLVVNVTAFEVFFHVLVVMKCTIAHPHVSCDANNSYERC